jgi:tetratricopeptide (TPR) repeat protein
VPPAWCAAGRLERVLELDPNYVLAATMLASRRCAAGLVRGRPGQRTHELIRHALQCAPHSADVWDALAHYHAWRSEKDKARAVLDEYVSTHPDSPRGWTLAARWLAWMGEFATSADAVLRAHRLHADDPEVCACATRVLPEAHRLEDLRIIVEDACLRFADAWSPLLAAAEAFAGPLGDPARAYALACRAVTLQPRSVDAWCRCGGVLSLLGRHEEAVRSYNTASACVRLPLDPCAVAIRMGLGRSWRALGRQDRAAAFFREAADVASERVLVDLLSSCALGEALEELGDLGGARRAYRAAPSVYAPAATALRRLDRRSCARSAALDG